MNTKKYGKRFKKTGNQILPLSVFSALAFPAAGFLAV
jgi:hypothetical protein